MVRQEDVSYVVRRARSTRKKKLPVPDLNLSVEDIGQSQSEIDEQTEQELSGMEKLQEESGVELRVKRKKHRPKVVVPGNSTPPRARRKKEPGSSPATNTPRPRKKRKQEVQLSAATSIRSGSMPGSEITVEVSVAAELLVERSEEVLDFDAAAQVQAINAPQARLGDQQRHQAQPPGGLEPQHRSQAVKQHKKPQPRTVEEDVEVLARVLESLAIEDGKLSLVPYTGAGALVPTVHKRKQKPRAKVNLDPESIRVWKLLMANEGESDETTKNMEKDRLEVKGKVLHFIDKMHLIQGNRKFSKWKGSVVDSVIGAFLTQNVSDHLSSSAFMAIAARFPVKPLRSTSSPCSCPTPHQDAGDVVYTTQEEEAFETGRQKIRRALFQKDGKEEEASDLQLLGLEQLGEDSGVNNSSNGLTEISAGTKTSVEGIQKEKQNSKRPHKSMTGKERSLLEQSRGKSEKSYDWKTIKSKIIPRKSNGAEFQSSDSADWEAMRQAGAKEVAKVIQERGMNNILAARMQVFLDRVHAEQGKIDLEWIRDVPPQDAKEFLLSIRGLGLKSVECIRLLALDHLAFPVDTNVGRILVRLGWVPILPLPEELQLHLLELYPVQETVQKYIWPRLCTLDRLTLYELHYQMITFGKVFCTKTKPNCNACPMKMDCRHFASAYASARLALPAPAQEELGNELAKASQEMLSLPPPVRAATPQPQPQPQVCEPIVEEPGTPEPEPCESSSACPDMEDLLLPEANGTLHINLIENDTQEPQYSIASASKELIVLPPEFAYIPVPKLKNVFRLRTVHYVYELPDDHALIEQLDPREKDDPCFYLLALWSQGNTQSNIDEDYVRATLLIPCRTAMRGSFPLNGTYFQVNEVFADNETSVNPLYVPRSLLWRLQRKFVYFGTSIPAIFRGLTVEEVQACFWRGYVCVRGFDRKLRSPKPLSTKLHVAPSNRKGHNTIDED